MSTQLLAKMGVFALIVVNLGAYYVFWPDGVPHAGNAGKAGAAAPGPEKGDNLGKPAQTAASAPAAQPGEAAKPSLLQGEVAPGTIPPLEPVANKPALPDPLVVGTSPSGYELPAIPKPFDPVAPAAQTSTAQSSTLTPVKVEDPTIEQLKRLKASFKESGKVAPPDPFTVPAKDILDLKPVPMPPPTPAPKPFQTSNSPWSLQMEIAGGQKVLTARLDKRTEFRIVCDQVEMKTLDGAVVAMGKVTFTGPGLKGACNRLTLGLTADSLVLDGKIEVQVQGGAADAAAELRGEQLMLRVQQPAGPGLTPVQAVPAPTPGAPTPGAPTPGAAEPFPIPRPFSPEKQGP